MENSETKPPAHDFGAFPSIRNRRRIILRMKRYASGATIQILLFSVLAVKVKQVAPSAHTVVEIVGARWGTAAHLTFLFFCLCTNVIVSAMLLLGGAATIEALTGLPYQIASFLIPWGVVGYTSFGGLQASFLTSYIQTVIIFFVLICMIIAVYSREYSTDQMFEFINQTASYTTEECEAIFASPETNVTFFEKGKYACGPVDGNKDGSYLTMMSSGGLMFGVINIVGNFGTVFVDNSYWYVSPVCHPSPFANADSLTKRDAQ
jgi:urea-proton symporter